MEESWKLIILYCFYEQITNNSSNFIFFILFNLFCQDSIICIPSSFTLLRLIPSRRTCIHYLSSIFRTATSVKLFFGALTNLHYPSPTQPSEVIITSKICQGCCHWFWYFGVEVSWVQASLNAVILCSISGTCYLHQG